MKPNELFVIIQNAEYTTVGDDVQYAIVEKDEGVYLLFQQSTSEEDWKVNFDFPAEVYKNQESAIIAHRGYVNAWKEINDQVLTQFINWVAATGKKPYIAGWSYGGAMAVLAAEDYFYRTTEKPELITFGAPKVLWGKKSRDYVRTCITPESKQYAHVNDLVPRLPPFFGYTQIVIFYVGTGKSFWKLFNPWKYHTMYGKAELYNV